MFLHATELYATELFFNKVIYTNPDNVLYALIEENFPVISLFVVYHWNTFFYL